MRCLLSLSFITLTAAAVLQRDGCDNPDGTPKFKYVAVFSVDGLHASDIDKWLAKGPSNISKLLDNGYRWTDAYTTFPSDSFPGTLAQYAGANPRTTGVWYDDTYDRSFYAPNSSCKGAPGAEVVYDETKDYNLDLLFSGGINPLNLPEAVINGKCTEIYPHMRTRVNTAFEVVVEAGMKTAYTDKHPAYDLLNGPSGHGLTTSYFPEINSAGDYTANVSVCIQYDTLHVNAFLDWLDGKVPANSNGALNGDIPSLFGGNFQSVSVGQKTAGYVAGSLDFSPQLLNAIKFVDDSLGLIVNKLKAKGIYDETLIIVASKHGQSPIDPTLLKKVDPDVFTAAVGVPVDFITFDDVALIFLKNQADLNAAVANLNKNKTALRIDDIIYGQRQIDLGFGDAKTDPAVPDICIQPVLGTIYTTSKSKIAEHGGGSKDDRNIAAFISNPRLTKKVFNNLVYTTQVAPTILKALGLSPNKLQGVRAEHTKPLDGFSGWGDGN